MGGINEIISQYARMRQNGLEAKEALQALRVYVEPLTKQEREALAQQVRAWEAAGGVQTSGDPTKTPPKIKPLATDTVRMSSIRKLEPNGGAAEEKPPTGWVACPNCGKTNQKHEVFCYACGQLLEPARGSLDTKHFEDTDPSLVSEDYFGKDSVLLLRLRGSAKNYESRPQLRDHELVVGRRAEGSAMSPDIDLADQQAGDLGVSRLHMSIRYDPEHNAIHVADLGSANGTFINGQRLHPKEVRVLRHGDELRLGKLILKVSFRHPGNQVN